MKARATGGDSTRLVELARTIAAGSASEALAMLAAAPELARAHSTVGASAESTEGFFFAEIAHYFYAGDTALHTAAASYDARLAARLLELGADCSARNRRGAQPLHYACDTNREDPQRQVETIRCLCAGGADPNALDKSGVTPLHRAVRTRGAAAVEVLLELGADPRSKNKSGSTPLHLAVQNTGRGGTGAEAAIAQQKQIIQLLLHRGAKPGDRDARRRSVLGAASADWIVELLENHPAR